MTGLNERRFAEIVASYGADPARWPDAERQAALDFAARPGAATILTAAGALDMALAGLNVAPAGRALRDAVLDIPMRDTQDAALPSPWRRFWPQLAAMATACVIGFSAGVMAWPEAAPVDAASVAFEDGGVTSNMVALNIRGME